MGKPTCYGVSVTYPNPKRYEDVERRDESILEAVRRVVPRVDRLPDGGFGVGERDLQFDAVSYGRGFTREEADKIQAAAASVGAAAEIRLTGCLQEAARHSQLPVREIKPLPGRGHVFVVRRR